MDADLLEPDDWDDVYEVPKKMFVPEAELWLWTGDHCIADVGDVVRLLGLVLFMKRSYGLTLSRAVELVG